MGSRKQTLIRLHSIIKRLYIDKDYDLFYRLSLRDDFKLSAEIVDFSNTQQIKIEKITSSNTVTPISHWNFFFPNFQSGESITKYTTYFCISKLCNAYYINHYFEIKDLNPDSFITDSMLEGEGFYGDPITHTQAKLADIIKDEMKNRGIEQLHVCDTEIVFPGIKYDTSATDDMPKYIIGTTSDDMPEETLLQLTYRNLLFNDDMLDILPWRP